MLSRENGNRKSCDFSWKIIVAKSLFYVMTAHEIALVYSIVERNFGTNRARISKIMLETGEMPIKELHRRTSQSSPRISSKIVKDSLHLFFQHDLLLLHSYPDFAEDGPYISFDARQAFFFPTEPAMCYAVEDIFGDEASRAVSLLLAMGTSPAEIFFTEFEQGDRVSRLNAEKTIIELLRARIFTAMDGVMKYDSDDRTVDVETLGRKVNWSKYAVKVNFNRLSVVFLLYLTQTKVENDPALGPVGCEVFLGLCRASLLCTALRADFLCDDLFLPVSGEDVLRNLPETSLEGMDYDIVTKNLAGIANLIDGFLLDSDQQYTLKGAKLLGMWAEHFLYETLRADLPHVAMARSVMQFLIRSPKPYLQAKALELELYGNSHALRYAINELCRLGFVDLMGTSHVATFEPGRTEVFPHVNLPRLFRQKLQMNFCENVFRNLVAMDARLAHNGAVDEEISKEKFEKMQLGCIDGLAFSLLYVRAAEAIAEERYSREAFSLLDFFSRNQIPEEQL